MEEVYKAQFFAGVQVDLGKEVLRETVYLPYSAAPSLIAVNVKVGIAYIHCQDARGCIRGRAEDMYEKIDRLRGAAWKMHKARASLVDIVSKVLAEADFCAAYRDGGDNEACYRVRTWLASMGVPWSGAEWGSFGGWDPVSQDPRDEDFRGYVEELRRLQVGYAAANPRGLEKEPPADTWYWMWQAEQIQLQDEGYHQARGHFCKMWVEVAPFDRTWWDEEPDDNFLEKSEVSDYFDDYFDNVDYSTAGIPNVTMLPRWLVGTDGVPVDQFNRVFEALQSAYVAELGGRDNARWPFAVENDRRPDDWLR
jgi:hypothetical protein